MKPTKKDPRNAAAVIKRKEELVVLAKQAGIDYETELKQAGDDNVARIGVLAKLLNIDAIVALNVAAPLTDIIRPFQLQPPNRS